MRSPIDFLKRYHEGHLPFDERCGFSSNIPGIRIDAALYFGETVDNGISGTLPLRISLTFGSPPLTYCVRYLFISGKKDLTSNL
ncbi:MAG: hypothetical protein AB1847_16255, partial [bacterium]